MARDRAQTGAIGAVALLGATALLLFTGVQLYFWFADTALRAPKDSGRELAAGGRYKVGDLVFQITPEERVAFYRDSSREPQQAEINVRSLYLSFPAWETIEIVAAPEARIFDYWCPLRKDDEIVPCGKCFLAGVAKPLPDPRSRSVAGQNERFLVYEKGEQPNESYVLVSETETFLGAPITLQTFWRQTFGDHNIYQTRIALSRRAFVNVSFRLWRLKGGTFEGFMHGLEEALRARISFPASGAFAHEGGGFCQSN